MKREEFIAAIVMWNDAIVICRVEAVDIMQASKYIEKEYSGVAYADVPRMKRASIVKRTDLKVFNANENR